MRNVANSFIESTAGFAYSSDESGRFEVYVRAFPDKGLCWQVSGAGGTAPMFSKNGRELFFRGALDDRIMVADYSVKGDSFVAEKPRARSETRLPQIGILRGQFDVTTDGKRLAALTYREGSAQQASGHVVFFQNFVDELRRKVPVSSFVSAWSTNPLPQPAVIAAVGPPRGRQPSLSQRFTSIVSLLSAEAFLCFGR